MLAIGSASGRSPHPAICRSLCSSARTAGGWSQEKRRVFRKSLFLQASTSLHGVRSLSVDALAEAGPAPLGEGASPASGGVQPFWRLQVLGGGQN